MMVPVLGTIGSAQPTVREAFEDRWPGQVVHERLPDDVLDPTREHPRAAERPILVVPRLQRLLQVAEEPSKFGGDRRQRECHQAGGRPPAGQE
jgi:hypothetical protein